MSIHESDLEVESRRLTVSNCLASLLVRECSCGFCSVCPVTFKFFCYYFHLFLFGRAQMLLNHLRDVHRRCDRAHLSGDNYLESSSLGTQEGE